MSGCLKTRENSLKIKKPGNSILGFYFISHINASVCEFPVLDTVLFV